MIGSVSPLVSAPVLNAASHSFQQRETERESVPDMYLQMDLNDLNVGPKTAYIKVLKKPLILVSACCPGSAGLRVSCWYSGAGGV